MFDFDDLPYDAKADTARKSEEEASHRAEEDSEKPSTANIGGYGGSVVQTPTDLDLATEVTILKKELEKERKLRINLEIRLSALEKSSPQPTYSLRTFPTGKPLPQPNLHPESWIAPGAVVIGNVVMEKNSSVWYNATLRGDNELIHIGEDTNIQDGTVIHCDEGNVVHIGKGCLIAHMCLLHGCKIGEGTLIGNRTMIMDKAEVGKGCFIAAGSVIGEKMKIPDGSFAGGNPCRVVDQVKSEMADAVKLGVEGYVKNWKRHRREMEPFEKAD